MINLDDNFFRCIDNLCDELYNTPCKEKLYNKCVSDRLCKVLELQTRNFDEALNKIDNSINWDLSNIANIHKITRLLNNLHKSMANDRIRVLDHLITLYEEEKK